MVSGNKQGAEQTALFKEKCPRTNDSFERGERTLHPWRYLVIVFCTLVFTWSILNGLWTKFKPDDLSKDPRKAAQQVLAAAPVIVRIALVM